MFVVDIQAPCSYDDGGSGGFVPWSTKPQGSAFLDGSAVARLVCFLLKASNGRRRKSRWMLDPKAFFLLRMEACSRLPID